MALRFRDDFESVILDWIARARRSVAGSADLDYEVLAPPHRDSPFLTLAERVGRASAGLPWRVLKLLLVLDDDPSEPFWRQVLERERDRWQGELRRRLTLPEEVDRLGLPLSPANGDKSDLVAHDLVALADVGPLRRRDVLDEAPDGGVRFTYLVRPFIAWPRLCDVGYSADQLQRRWRSYCQGHGVTEHLRELLFDHFCHEALTDGGDDVLLTSAWRLGT